MDVIGSLIGLDQSAMLGGATHLLSALFPGTNLPVSTDSKGASPTSFAFLCVRAVVLGFVLNWVRKVYQYLLNRAQKLLFPTAFISAQDPAHRWLTAWIASDLYAQSQLDDFVLNTREISKIRSGAQNTFHGRDWDHDPNSFSGEEATWQSAKIIGRVLPPRDQTIRLKFNGTYIWIGHPTAMPGGHPGFDQMGVTTLGFQRSVLMQFLAAAHDRYFAKEDHELLIFHTEASSYAAWMEPISRPARPWGSVILPMKDVILKDMQRFLSEKEIRWYAARGIPHRRGYLFHGSPGAGKTTLVTALASRLRLDIYVINISQSGMDDNKLGELFRNCRTQSIILIEDIDRVFAGSDSISTSKVSDAPASRRGDAMLGVGGLMTPLNSSGPRDDESIHSGMEEQGVMAPRQKKEASLVTMSGLLNAIDGVSSQEGCLLIASTNHPDKLDPALCRAGRFDVRVPFDYATPEQARALFLHFFPLADFIDRSSNPELLSELDEKPVGLYDLASQTEIDDLAQGFADAVFSPTEAKRTQVAMASLQAYLLNFKENPREAVRQAGEWARSDEKGALSLSSPGMMPIERGKVGLAD